MALQFNAVERPNPQTKAKKWYASSKLTGKRTLKDFSQDLADVSSLSAGDVQNVIANLNEQMPKWLMEGDSVKLDGFGTFRLSFSSEGVATKEEVTASLIKDIYILFEPDEEIKERVRKTKVNPAF
ncbi:MAG TPA: HU family DNA-binding protein [Prolixibacteraceae bacterium]|nr:HU family DNA-binding protein [Prolixibacteraceae bacterium]HPS12853.1 HU family DNA-binding protein [Prolixibacteraceae bacterium]